jgi:Asp-tRNA(Asn)/Glu-tRNA(Gln) amidotransferase A subunit family amidase
VSQISRRDLLTYALGTAAVIGGGAWIYKTKLRESGVSFLVDGPLAHASVENFIKDSAELDESSFIHQILRLMRSHRQALEIFVDVPEDQLRRHLSNAWQATQTSRPNAGSTPEFRLLRVPFSVKDNLDVIGFAKSAGTRLGEMHFPRKIRTQDSWAVSRLRIAGGIPLPFTNMTELALGYHTESANLGWTRHPLNLQLALGGSSGGAAASVAAGICPIGLATDTGGSIRIPAAMCGLYGYRPSRGRISLDGALILSDMRDSIGPITRSFADLEIAASALIGLPITSSLSSLKNLNFHIDQSLKLEPEVQRMLADFEIILKNDGGGVQLHPQLDIRSLIRWSRRDMLYEVELNFAQRIHEEFNVDWHSPEVQSRLLERTRTSLAGLQQFKKELKLDLPDRSAWLAWFEKHRLDREKLATNFLSSLHPDRLRDGRILVQPALPFQTPKLAASLQMRDYADRLRALHIISPVLQAPSLVIPAPKTYALGCGIMLTAAPGMDEHLFNVASRISRIWSDS